MKPNHKSFAQIFAEAHNNLTYHVEGAILEFTEETCRIMETQGVTKSELAKRLGCQPAYVTKLLSGQNNFTLETMVKVARVLESEIKIHLQGPGVESHWEDVENIIFTGKVIGAGCHEKFIEDWRGFGNIKPASTKPLVYPASERSTYSATNELAIAA